MSIQELDLEQDGVPLCSRKKKGQTNYALLDSANLPPQPEIWLPYSHLGNSLRVFSLNQTVIKKVPITEVNRYVPIHKNQCKLVTVHSALLNPRS